MALTDKLTAIGDGFRLSRGTTQQYTLDEMAVLAAEPEAPPTFGVTLTDKLTSLADGFRASRGTEQKYTLDEMAVMAAEPINVPKYTALEYIQSSGTQYIDTGYCPTANTRVVADVYLLNHKDYLRMYGVSGNNQDFYCVLYTERWTIRFGSSSASSSITKPTGSIRYTIDHAGKTTTFTGSSSTYNCSITATDSFSGTSANPIYIFAVNNKGTPGTKSSFKLYSFKIYEGDVLVRDFVPVRWSDGVNGLLDNVSETFYQNAGTGAFMSNLSEDAKSVPSGYTQLKYIDGSGTQYINTGFCPTAYTRVITQINLLDYKKDARIYGAMQTSQKFAMYATGGTWYVHYGDKAGSTYGAGEGVSTIDHQGSMAACKDAISRTHYARCTTPTFTGTSSSPMCIFTYFKDEEVEPANIAAIRVYFLKIYNEGVLVRWFVPVRRDSDGEVGMYDLVNESFYANAGTGSFIASAN